MIPQVQTLEQILATLNPAYQPQQQLIQGQISAIPGQNTAVMAGLDATKTNAFRDINTNANSRGMLFSGIPGTEQARYLGEKYLPAVADLKTASTNKQLTLEQALAQLTSDQRLRALDTQSSQQSALTAFQQHQQDQQFSAEQAALDRRAAAASSSSRAPTASELKMMAAQTIQQNFNQRMGGDKKVSNETWNNGLNAWVASGGKAQDFWQNYGQYVNRKYANKYAGYVSGYGQKYTS